MNWLIYLSKQKKVGTLLGTSILLWNLVQIKLSTDFYVVHNKIGNWWFHRYLIHMRYYSKLIQKREIAVSWYLLSDSYRKETHDVVHLAWGACVCRLLYIATAIAHAWIKLVPGFKQQQDKHQQRQKCPPRPLPTKATRPQRPRQSLRDGWSSTKPMDRPPATIKTALSRPEPRGRAVVSARPEGLFNRLWTPHWRP